MTDGVFSMRGDHAPLDRIMALARGYDSAFAEGAIVVVDDLHGVGAFGPTGRGSEEYAVSSRADLLVATLGKAFGVNGGYVVAEEIVIRYLRETSPSMFIRTRSRQPKRPPPTRQYGIVDSPAGAALLAHLRKMTARFKAGLIKLGFETLPGEHPVVPLLARDTARTLALVAHLRQRGILPPALPIRWCRKAMRRSAFRSARTIRQQISTLRLRLSRTRPPESISIGVRRGVHRWLGTEPPSRWISPGRAKCAK